MKDLPGTGQYFDVVIVGSGFAGAGIAIKLKEDGKRTFVILEKDSETSGTWRVNQYPGAACDVQSYLYSYSFEPNPNWTRMFSPQEEILEYQEQCLDKYGIRDHIRCGKNVVSAVFDEPSGRWNILTEDGDLYTCKLLLTGTGGLSRPKYPAIPGRASFKGPAFHTQHWDASFDYRGKRVAVIGTGASAIQVIPAIAGDVKKLAVFQRSAAWVMPKPDRKISRLEQSLSRIAPLTQRLYREWIYWTLELRALAFTSYPQILKIAQREAVRNIEKGIKDPDLRKKVTPDYTMGCKRILLADNYYPALARENVDVITEHIDRIEENAVVTADGKRHEVDAIIFATGFEASDNMAPFTIKGLKGRELAEVWKGGGQAYKGTAIAGFPNLFMITGPNTGLGHSSMIHMMESHFQYIMKALPHVFEEGVSYLTVRKEAEEEYNRMIQRRLKNTVWMTGGCDSWYLNKEGKNTTLWPGFTVEFRWITSRFDPGKYRIVRKGRPVQKEKRKLEEAEA